MAVEVGMKEKGTVIVPIVADRGITALYPVRLLQRAAEDVLAQAAALITILYAEGVGEDFG